MIAEPWFVVLGVQVLIGAAAWGRFEARQKVQDERHLENKAALVKISDNVQRINGQVGRHDERLKALEQ